MYTLSVFFHFHLLFEASCVFIVEEILQCAFRQHSFLLIKLIKLRRHLQIIIIIFFTIMLPLGIKRTILHYSQSSTCQETVFLIQVESIKLFSIK